MAWTSLAEPENFGVSTCDQTFLLIVLYLPLKLASSTTTGPLTALLGQNASY